MIHNYNDSTFESLLINYTCHQQMVDIHSTITTTPTMKICQPHESMQLSGYHENTVSKTLMKIECNLCH